MKNVYTSLDINLLADKMMEKIQESWKSPFCSPAVVFTDPKTEQWFKLHWLKKQGAGNSILMNLKTLRIQQFLFDLVTPKSPDSRDIQKLSVEMLRDVIITKLTEKNAGKYYFETLGAPEVVSYLTSENSDSKINANHLYDFSETVASLFMDYEDTRPDTLNDVLDKSSWQKKLYSDVTGTEGIKIKGTQYLTLFQLAELNKKANNDTLTFNWPSDRPVFIFGFSGLGQIYRNILNDFSKEHTLEIFLQAMEYNDNPDNQLLGKWAEFGRDHLQLWTKDSPAQKPDNADSFSKTDSILHRIQKSISENSKLVQEPFNATDNSLTLTAAPTRLREVEALHTKICQLLSDENQNTQLGDILVVAPQIQDYKTVIEQVFDQTDQFSTNSAFPYIPYTIADFSGERSLTAEALNILFGILKKCYLSRSDVFALLHNYLVQSVRGISDEEVSEWADWSADLNIYRDREGHEEWQKAKNRLLLARLTDELVETNDRQFLPFESMTTANSDSLYKFIQMVDELEEWSSFFEKQKLTVTDIDCMEELIKNWLLLNDNIPEGLYNETLVFQNVVEEIERQRLTALPDVFTDCFANALFDRSAAVSLHSANILTRGITFANFESNRVLSAKYIFFMGLDSKAFPGVDTDNELDLRNIIENRQTGDESIPLKNKNAFLCQLMAAREGLFISYVNKNLQKDEDYFMSSVLKDLFETIYPFYKKLKKQIYEEIINIDEDRFWNELYTQREFRNKKNFIKLQENENEGSQTSGTSQQGNPTQNTASASQEAQALPDRVTIGNMKYFLQEPFVFMVNQKLNNDFDDEEKEQLEFEPLSLNGKISSDIRKAYIQSILQNENTITKESISFDLNIHNALPDDFFGDMASEIVLKNSNILLEKIRTDFAFTDNLVFNENKMLQIKQIDGITPKDWIISGELAWYNKDFVETKNLYTLELLNYENVLTGYLTSLILLASQPETDTNEYNISLNVAGLKDNKSTQPVTTTKVYKATPALARILLNKIYNAMFISRFEKSAPVKVVEDDYKNKDPEKALSFSAFKKKLTDSYGNGEWRYFSKKKLFDLDKDIGYTHENYLEVWKAARNHQAELIQYIEQSVNSTNSRGE